jgi:predicted  nucleic acid-binding Zn-ribbon protein
MNRRKASKNVDTVQNKNSGWSEMLSDVNLELQKTQRKIAALEQSAAIIQRKIASGEPFPGNVSRQDQPQNA